MTTNEYSLQLLHHGSVFADRETAMQYIKEEFKNKALLAEPAVVFYGEESNPNVIIAIGSGDKKVFFIDTAKLADELASTTDRAEDNKKKIEGVSTALKEVVAQVGLVWDENKRTNQIAYEPDSHDELIGNAETLAEAVSVISEYVQSQFKDNALSVKDTESIKLTFTDAPSGGKLLKASLNLSHDGEDDEVFFNDNILGIKNDGLFAAVNLSYDEATRKLTFTTSGNKNGRFVDDVIRQVIYLGEHAQYTPNNLDHTVEMSVDTVDAAKNKFSISGDVKISNTEDNILKNVDGKLAVIGRAGNIKYKKSNVFEGLNAVEHDVEALQSEIQRINDTHFIDGDESDTIVISTIKQPLGNYKVTGDVRLGANKTIKVMDGGLEVNLDIESDLTNNQLIVKLGDNEKKINLPGIQLLSDVRYDASTRAIVVSTTDGKSFTIPVGDLISTWVVENAANCPVELVKTTSTTSAPDVLSAKLNISNKSGNILSIDEQGKLLADSTAINTKIEEEIARATAAEQANATAINDHVLAVEQKVDDVLASTDSIKENLIEKINTVDDRVIVLEGKVNVAEGKIANLEANDTDINSQIANINGDIAQVKSDLRDTTSVANNNKTAIEALSVKTTGISDRVHALENGAGSHDEKYEALAEDFAEVKTLANKNASDIVTERERAIEKEGILKTDLDLAKQSIATLQGTVAENTSNLGHLIEHVQQDIEADIAAEIEARRAADADLQSQVTNLNGLVGDGLDAALSDAKAYTDAEVAKHKVSTTNDIANAKSEAIAAAATDATTKANAAIETAKAYTDAEVAKHVVDVNNAITTAQRDALDEAKADATAKSADTLAAAKAYTDTEKERAMTAEAANTAAITALQARDLQLTDAINGKVSHVEVVKNSTSDLQYILKVDGVDAGEINIPKDQFLKSAEYNAVSKEIVFTFVTSDGESTSTINIADLVDTYTAGDGLKLENNKFSVKLCGESESYLSVTEDGFILTGIDEALALKANKSEVYSKVEADGKFLTAHQDISSLATKAEVADVNAYVDAVSAKADANESALVVVNGNYAQDGSIENALFKAKSYTDEQIAPKANAADVYTKGDIDAKGFLTSHQDITGLAEKTTVNALAGRVATAEGTLATLTGNEAEVGSVKNAIRVAKEYADGELAKKATILEVTSLEGRVSAAESAITVINGNESEVGSVKNAIKVSKDYTDAQVAVKANASDVYTKSDIEAKGYLVDADIADLVANGAFNNAIAELQAKDVELTTEVGKKIEKVEVVKNSASDLQYILKVDGVDAGEINIPKDNFLKSVRYSEAEKTIYFLFETSTGAVETTVNIADLVDTYEAGDGLKLENNKFVAVVSAGSENYLTVDENGISLNGINAALETKANKSDVYTKAEIDAKGYLTEHQDISGLATKAEVDAVDAKTVEQSELIASVESRLNVVQGNEAQNGSILNAIKVSKNFAEEQINAEFNRAHLVEQNLAEEIAVINGYVGQEGSIKNAISKANAYTDSAVAYKADASNVYTKAEIDAKGYLTEHQDISGLATKASVNEVKSDVIALDSELGELEVSVAINTTDIASLKEKAVRLNLTGVDGKGIETIVSKSDEGTTITSNVLLRNSADNIITMDAEGLYANVTLAYNKATNTLSFNNGSGVVNFELSEASLLRTAYYDSVNKEIVMLLTVNGEDREVRVPAADFVNSIEVENSDTNPVRLVKTSANGVDTINAELIISNEDGNLIKSGERSLYASNHADDHKAHWGGDEDDISVQTAINRLKEKTDLVDGIVSDVADIKTRVTTAELDIAQLKMTTSDVVADMANVLQRMTETETTVDNFRDVLTGIAAQFDNVVSIVNGMNSRVSNVETSIETLLNDVAVIKRNLTDTTDDTTVASRLARVEYEIDNLVDFGEDDSNWVGGEEEDEETEETDP